MAAERRRGGAGESIDLKEVNRAAGSLSLLDRLFDLLEAEAIQEGGAASEAFRRQMEGHRAQLGSAAGAAEIEHIGTACLDTCRQYWSAVRSSRSEREAGLREVIRLLRESLNDLVADGGTFNADLQRASERMCALVDETDIRILKQRLRQEVDTVKRAVEEKQRRDEEHRASLTKRVEMLETTLVETRIAASVDPLTQVANRGQFDCILERWLATYRGTGRSFVLALVDLDDFKAINDTYGHTAGDCVLQGAARSLTASVRPSDLVARYGGDEFALLLANMTLDQAGSRIPEVVAKVAQTEYRYEKVGATGTVGVTISCGMAELSRNDTRESLIERADEALYAAKRQGRNRAVAKRASLWRTLFAAGDARGRGENAAA
jgi:diguanylate cyclase